MEQGLLILVGVNILMAWSFYVILTSGQVSLGNAGFMAIGAYASSVATVNFNVPYVGGLIIAIIAGAISGWLVGLPALRIRGVYLAMATIGFGFVVEKFFANFEYTGTITGFKGMAGTTVWSVYVVVTLLALFFLRIEKSRLGKSLQAVRENEIVAGTLGLNTTYLKLLSFSIGASVASLAGALYAHYIFFISSEHFSFWQSIWPTFYVVIGGSNTVIGSILGSAIVTLLPEYFRFLQEWRVLVFGLVVMVLIAIRPEGLYAHDVERWLVSRVKRLLTRRAVEQLAVEHR